MRKVKKIGGIAKDTLEFIRAVCKSNHPREFIGLLCADADLITDVFLLPGTRSSEEQAIIRMDMMPIGLQSVGSVHSHPTPGATKPSAQDLLMFSARGDYHIIVCFPYDEQDWRCYNSRGEERELEVVERDVEHVDGG
jgi:proteasome lid subunit RPN8/RPN11